MFRLTFEHETPATTVFDRYMVQRLHDIIDMTDDEEIIKAARTLLSYIVGVHASVEG